MDKEREKDLTAIKDTLNQYAIECNTGNFEGWLSLWAEEGKQMPPDTPARIGIDAIREGMRPVFDDMNLDIVIKSVDDVEVHGDLGLTRCKYSLKLTPKAGGETLDVMPDGKALTLFGKQKDGSWRIVYDCFNSNVPAE
ncbi:MAG: YybH family protein [Promethearchaeota archaeon]